MASKKTNSEQLLLEDNGSGFPWETKGLFSDHYLRRWLKITDVWPSDVQVNAAYTACKDLIDRNKYRLGRYANEAETRQEFIDKVLGLLGFDFLPNQKQPGKSQQEPDYLLFANSQSKEAARDLMPKQRYSLATSICEAKKFGHNLGAVSKEETPGRFPHNQIRDYLQNAYDEGTQRAYFNWAILTNGGEWRLYTRNAQTTSYLSLDLERAVTSKDGFKYFWVLFNASAFVPDAEGRCTLDRLRDQSLSHQTELESNLRTRVYKLLERLANGYYHHKKNKITKDDREELYSTCLIFLYRLLFILYAEGRDLLPVRRYVSGANELYLERFSLRRLRESLKKPVRREDDVFYRLYHEIEELFTLINGDDEELNARCRVPRYNGGLFDPNRTAGLRKKWRVGDYTLTEVLKQLVFSPLPTAEGETLAVNFEEFIDYAELEVRQLGSIYEGLLEHRLETTKGGRLKLTLGNHERKETGSYYTPDYIVKYIVSQTLKPLLHLIENSERINSAKSRDLKDNSFADAVLNLKVLDPAMGSGHFLVRATEYLAEEIASHPTTILATEYAPAGLSHDWVEVAYWRRRVVESCIFGVDKNPLAVELAKLSLWLTCISSDQPLNFLDHHLRCGNSLVGCDISDMNRLPTKDGYSGHLFKIKGIEKALDSAIHTLMLIKSKASDQVDVVKEKESIYQKEVQTRLAPFRAVADARTAFDFGIKLDEASFTELAETILHAGVMPPADAQEGFPKVWAEVRKAVESDTYFHWELEFPEVFRDGGANGFDAVIGNPPYVRQETLGEFKAYLERRYSTFAGAGDLYVTFIEKGINLLKVGGRFGMIVSNKWMRARYGEGLRSFVKQYQIEKLVDFGELKVFESSATFPLIMLVSKSEPKSRPLYAPIKRLDFPSLEEEVASAQYELEEGALAPAGFALVQKDMTDIMEKMKAVGTPLGEYVKGRIYRGILTGFNEAFIIDRRKREELIKADPKSEEIIKPFVVGDDVRKYQINFRERYLILTKIGVEIDDYPAIFEHLKSYQKQLEKRWDKGNHWWELRACDYYEEFEKPKIVWPEIAMESRFAFDKKSLYFNKTCFIMPVSDFYLLGVLNSRLVWSFLKRICPVLGDPDKRGRLTQQATYVKQIPVYKVVARDKARKSAFKEIEKLVMETLRLNEELVVAFSAIDKRRLQERISETEKDIDRLVYQIYGLTDKEIAVVEGSV